MGTRSIICEVHNTLATEKEIAINICHIAADTTKYVATKAPLAPMESSLCLMLSICIIQVIHLLLHSKGFAIFS